MSVGGGGTRLNDDTTRVVTEITRMVRGGPRSGLAVRGRVVELLAAGYTPGEITRHVHARTAAARDRGTITSPAGLLRHVLDADDLPPALAQVTAERNAARQREAIDRHQVATATGTTTRREAIDEALGPVLRGRLVAAVIATSEVYQRSRRTPAFIAGLLDTTYAAHDHDVDRIRIHAETLPPVVSETPIPAPETPVESGPTPTHPDGTVRPSLADLETAVAQRVGGAA
ncbi:hypothetical protein [Parafrankia sp. CH37]|uniref:hypothetical protein n=1 Tax=Parafrankia sp. CH37 TaxID=683308 RepID=UPI001D020D4F|nr:hypothetical protein [Parafrankia sp. CH37]